MKNIIWAISKISNFLIKTKTEEEKEYDVNKLILKSKLFSGGIQNRFLNLFSKEAIQTIKNVAAVTGDENIMEYLGTAEENEEDKTMLAFIHKGTNPTIDLFIDLLEWSLKRKKPQLCIADKNCVTLSRCAFAATLYLNKEECSYTDLLLVLEHLELVGPDLDENLNENQRFKELVGELESIGNFKPFLQRWESSSKMRTWLKEKQKDISNKIEQRADTEIVNENEESKFKDKIRTMNTINEEEHKDLLITASDQGVKSSHRYKMKREDMIRKEQEHVTIIVNKIIKKTELLLKFASPRAWNDADISDSKILMADMNDPSEIEMEKNSRSIVETLARLKSIQESQATVTDYENVADHQVLKSCVSSVLACLQSKITADAMLKHLETTYLKAMNRWCGFKLMSQLTACSISNESMVSCLNSFCSALRHNKNVLAHYSDELSGMGDYLLTRCRHAFFEVYNNIVSQLKNATDKKDIEFLLNCLKWRIGATDHKYLLKSGIIQVLRIGNGKDDKEKNPIKFSWGEPLDYKPNIEHETLSHMVIDTFEFIILACFSRILGEDEDKDLLLKSSESSTYKLQMAQSVVNTSETEILLGSCLEIVFEQLTKYTKIMSKAGPRIREKESSKKDDIEAVQEEEKRPESAQPGDDEETRRLREQFLQELRDSGMDPAEVARIESNMMAELARYNELQSNEYSAQESEAQPANNEVQEEEEKKHESIEEDHKEMPSNGDQNDPPNDKDKNSEDRPDYDEIEQIYDKHLALKFLRLIEIFTAIANKSQNINLFVTKVAKPIRIHTLIELSLRCQQTQHSMIVLQILSNLLQLGIGEKTITEAFVNADETSWEKKIFSIPTRVEFGDQRFLQFIYNSILLNKMHQWMPDQILPYGCYDASKGVIKIFNNIMRSEQHKEWKDAIQQELDSFLKNFNEYTIEDTETLLSIFEGGEYCGLSYGVYGLTKDNSKFVTAGFTSQWYNLDKDGNPKTDTNLKIYNHKTEYNNINDKVLGISYDERHPERNEMILVDPEEVVLIPSLNDSFNEYLLNEITFDAFAKALKLDEAPDRNNTEDLMKKCLGMKILIAHICHDGEKTNQVMDEDFKQSLISQLLGASSKANKDEDTLKYEWYEQKLHALKRFASETLNNFEPHKQLKTLNSEELKENDNKGEESKETDQLMEMKENEEEINKKMKT